jgi:hypothetical protein
MRNRCLQCRCKWHRSTLLTCSRCISMREFADAPKVPPIVDADALGVRQYDAG